MIGYTVYFGLIVRPREAARWAFTGVVKGITPTGRLQLTDVWNVGQQKAYADLTLTAKESRDIVKYTRFDNWSI